MVQRDIQYPFQWSRWENIYRLKANDKITMKMRKELNGEIFE